MNRKSDIKKELEELAPKLAKLEKNEDTFSQDFFDAMEKDILNKTVGKKAKVKPLIQKMLWLRAAAVVAGLAVALYLFNYTSNTQQSDWQAQLEGVSDAEIVAFLEQDIEAIRLEDLEDGVETPLDFLDVSTDDIESVLEEDKYTLSINYFD